MDMTANCDGHADRLCFQAATIAISTISELAAGDDLARAISATGKRAEAKYVNDAMM